MYIRVLATEKKNKKGSFEDDPHTQALVSLGLFLGRDLIMGILNRSGPPQDSLAVWYRESLAERLTPAALAPHLIQSVYLKRPPLPAPEERIDDSLVLTHEPPAAFEGAPIAPRAIQAILLCAGLVRTFTDDFNSYDKVHYEFARQQEPAKSNAEMLHQFLTATGADPGGPIALRIPSHMHTVSGGGKEDASTPDRTWYEWGSNLFTTYVIPTSEVIDATMNIVNDIKHVSATPPSGALTNNPRDLITNGIHMTKYVLFAESVVIHALIPLTDDKCILGDNYGITTIGTATGTQPCMRMFIDDPARSTPTTIDIFPLDVRGMPSYALSPELRISSNGTTTGDVNPDPNTVGLYSVIGTIYVLCHLSGSYTAVFVNTNPTTELIQTAKDPLIITYKGTVYMVSRQWLNADGVEVICGPASASVIHTFVSPRPDNTPGVDVSANNSKLTFWQRMGIDVRSGASRIGASWLLDIPGVRIASMVAFAAVSAWTVAKTYSWFASKRTAAANAETAAQVAASLNKAEADMLSRFVTAMDILLMALSSSEMRCVRNGTVMDVSTIDTVSGAVISELGNFLRHLYLNRVDVVLGDLDRTPTWLNFRHLQVVFAQPVLSRKSFLTTAPATLRHQRRRRAELERRTRRRRLSAWT